MSYPTAVCRFCSKPYLEHVRGFLGHRFCADEETEYAPKEEAQPERECFRCMEFTTVINWRNDQLASAKAAGCTFPEPGITCINDRAEKAEAELLAALAQVQTLQAELKTVLDREAATTERYDGKVETLQRALEMACSESVKIEPKIVKMWIEAARKEGEKGR